MLTEMRRALLGKAVDGSGSRPPSGSSSATRPRGTVDLDQGLLCPLRALSLAGIFQPIVPVRV